MDRRIAMVLVVAALALASPALAAKKPATRPGDDVFGNDRVWVVHLRMSVERWEAMQPKERGGMWQQVVDAVKQDGQRRAPATQKAPDAKQIEKELQADEGLDAKESPFGGRFPYVRATVELNGEVVRNVGLRFKGNASYGWGARGLKRPFKLDFNRFDTTQEFHGLSQLNLHNNSFDPSQLREPLSYETFRQAGIPSPRTAFALVYLTVDGKYNRECLGIYTLTEELGKKFLKEHYGNAKGLLLKPERVGLLPYLGEDWESYHNYGIKTEGTPAIQKRFIEFVKLVNQADDDAFRKQIDSYLAVDEFLRFVAVNALLSNLDSFLTGGHNYYIYLDAGDNKVRILPWDMHLSLAGWGPARDIEEQTNLSITRPYIGRHTLIKRVLAIEEYRNAYLEHVKRLMATTYSPQSMDRQIDAMQAMLKKAEELAQSSGKPLPPISKETAGLGSNMPDLRLFVDKRVESVLAQMEGKKKGFVPSFEGRQRFGDRPRLGMGLARPLAVAMLAGADADKDGKLSKQELTAAIRKFFASADKRNRGVLGEVGIGEALGDIMPESLGGGKREEIQGIGIEWRWDGPNALLAKAIMRRANTTPNGRVSADELAKLAESMFRGLDDDEDGGLDLDELTEAIAVLLRPSGKE
jgi:spore coat protein CotH